MQYFLFGVLALATVLLVMQRAAHMNAAVLARSLTIVGGVTTLVIGVVMLVRGWTGPGLGLTGIGTYVLLRLAKPWRWSTGGPSAPPRSVSRVRTEHLDVELEHDTGAVRGQVLQGFFTGRDLETLRPVELAHLWADCQFADPQSAQILEVYLDRVHPTWRDDMARTSGGSGAHARQETPSGEVRMSQDEALDILGLKIGASAEDIRRAHRDLMLKLHPDRGGSHILASKVNEAKDVLLG